LASIRGTIYDYQGNLSELEYISARAVALINTSRIEVYHLPEDFKRFKIITFRKKKAFF
jgi:DNA-binding NtrC family response regulator